MTNGVSRQKRVGAFLALVGSFALMGIASPVLADIRAQCPYVSQPFVNDSLSYSISQNSWAYFLGNGWEIIPTTSSQYGLDADGSAIECDAWIGGAYGGGLLSLKRPNGSYTVEQLLPGEFTTDGLTSAALNVVRPLLEIHAVWTASDEPVLGYEARVLPDECGSGGSLVMPDAFENGYVQSYAPSAQLNALVRVSTLGSTVVYRLQGGGSFGHTPISFMGCQGDVLAFRETAYAHLQGWGNPACTVLSTSSCSGTFNVMTTPELESCVHVSDTDSALQMTPCTFGVGGNYSINPVSRTWSGDASLYYQSGWSGYSIRWLRSWRNVSWATFFYPLGPGQTSEGYFHADGVVFAPPSYEGAMLWQAMLQGWDWGRS